MLHNGWLISTYKLIDPPPSHGHTRPEVLALLAFYRCVLVISIIYIFFTETTC